MYYGDLKDTKPPNPNIHPAGDSTPPGLSTDTVRRSISSLEFSAEQWNTVYTSLAGLHPECADTIDQYFINPNNQLMEAMKPQPEDGKFDPLMHERRFAREPEMAAKIDRQARTVARGMVSKSLREKGIKLLPDGAINDMAVMIPQVVTPAQKSDVLRGIKQFSTLKNPDSNAARVLQTLQDRARLMGADANPVSLGRNQHPVPNPAIHP